MNRIRARAAFAGGFLLFLFTLHSSPFVQAQCVPDTLLRTIPNPEPGPHDNFGGSVAISGDLAVVGPHFDTNQPGLDGAGTVHVFNTMSGIAKLASLNNPAPAQSPLRECESSGTGGGRSIPSVAMAGA